jgi:hypothetical protein
MTDDWTKGVVEGHVADRLVHDVLREQLSLLGLRREWEEYRPGLH